MMKRNILFLLFLLPAVTSFAQFKGLIVNAKDKPVKNISVNVKNSKESAVSDKEGRFTLNSINANDTLVVAATKKLDAIIPIGEMKKIVIVLDKKNFVIKNDNLKLLREYHKNDQKTFSSNIITGEQIERMSAHSIYEILRNGFTGVTVIDTENGPIVVIRGGSSLESGNEALFVIDGMTYESSSEVDSQLSVHDIEKIEILKEGSGYGVRGANGVVIITTKK